MDEYFGAPFIDVDEWRDAPTRHRYVHGGFEGTQTRFSCYFPPPERYEGRFLHSIGSVGGDDTSQLSGLASMISGGLEFPFAAFGAYVVESNQGFIGTDPEPEDRTIVSFRASAESARYSRQLAAEMYGGAPHHGYVWGASIGGFRTIMAIENVDDVWDGGAALVIGTGMSLAAGASMAADVRRVFGADLGKVVDSLEPGGTGDPFSGLVAAQAEVLGMLLPKWMSRRALFQLDRPTPSPLPSPFLVGRVKEHDPDYFSDFWTAPGYGGADGGLATVLVEHKGRVKRVLPLSSLPTPLADPFVAMADPVVVELDPPAPPGAKYASVSMVTGGAAGRELACLDVAGDLLVVGRSDVFYGSDKGVPQALAAGDEVVASNRDFLAFCNYHRYVRGHAGDPEHPRTPTITGEAGCPSFHLATTGRFTKKMILANATMDAQVPVSAGIRYLEQVQAAGGEARFRLWWVDHAGHVPGVMAPPGPAPVMATRLVDYRGHAQQVIADLIDWVERGVEPSPSSGSTLDDGELRLAPTAAERRGLQPVVRLQANGADRTSVRVGEPVTLSVRAETPPNTGRIIKVELDFDGKGTWPYVNGDVDGSATSVAFSVTHAFDAPGAYFPTVRVEAHRDGDTGAAYFRIENIARARVVVE